MIEVEDLHLVYPQARGTDNPVLEGISLRVEQGESLAVLGPSGCGKSSFLYVLAGLVKPTSGRVEIDGRPVERPRPEVALILQETGLLPWKTVWQNATLGLKLEGVADVKRIKRALRDLGLEGLEGRYPAQLSGGEKKRVSLARALAQNATVLLMDEPLAALDTLTKEHTQNIILRLWHKHGFTLVLVTHDIEEAVFLGQRIVILSERPARIVETIPNPDMGEEAYRQSQAFFERVREVRAHFQAQPS
jgi:NitT/TauT family transport system ATP-binding protein